jgi:hypothetical protein
MVVTIGPNPTLSTQEMMALRPEWFHAWKQKQDFAVNICHLSDSFDQSDIHLQSILRSWGYHKYLSPRPFI